MEGETKKRKEDNEGANSLPKKTKEDLNNDNYTAIDKETARTMDNIRSGSYVRRTYNLRMSIGSSVKYHVVDNHVVMFDEHDNLCAVYSFKTGNEWSFEVKRGNYSLYGRHVSLPHLNLT